MLVLEPLEPRPDEWDEILAQFPTSTIFQSSAWISFIARTQSGKPIFLVWREGGEVRGYYVGLIVRKFGLKILGSPLRGWTTSYMGLNLLQGMTRRRAAESLVSFAFDELGCVHLEMMDRHATLDDLDGLGFECKMQNGFEIDLRQTEERVFSRMTSGCRRCIRKAAKSGVTIEPAADAGFADDYYSQLEEVYGRQSLAPSYSIDRVRHLIESLYPTGRLLLLRALDRDRRCIATGIFPAMNRTMYFWGGASWRAHQILRPNESIHWYAMRYWRERGIEAYDMGGGGAYKRKYGGEEISVPWVRKSKFRSVGRARVLAERLVKSRSRLSGIWKRSIAKALA